MTRRFLICSMSMSRREEKPNPLVHRPPEFHYFQIVLRSCTDCVLSPAPPSPPLLPPRPQTNPSLQSPLRVARSASGGVCFVPTTINIRRFRSTSSSPTLPPTLKSASDQHLPRRSSPYPSSSNPPLTLLHSPPNRRAHTCRAPPPAPSGTL